MGLKRVLAASNQFVMNIVAQKSMKLFVDISALDNNRNYVLLGKVKKCCKI